MFFGLRMGDVEAVAGEGGGELDYQAISIVLHDSKNQSLHGTLNFTVWKQQEEVSGRQ